MCLTLLLSIVFYGCQTQMPYAYLWGNNHSTMYYNAGTFLQIGFPSGIDIRIKTIECGISAGKNYSAVATTIKTEDGEHLYFKSRIILKRTFKRQYISIFQATITYRIIFIIHYILRHDLQVRRRYLVVSDESEKLRVEG